MVKGATHRPTGTSQALSTALDERRQSAERAGLHDSADLESILKAIAARLDVVLDDKGTAAAEPDGPDRAVQAWSSVVGKQATGATAELRRHALATTVLRISADGRVDLDDRTSGIAYDTVEKEAEPGPVVDRHHDAAGSDEKGMGADIRSQVVDSSRTVLAEPPSSVAADRSDVENRLRAVRARLAARHASTSTANVDASHAGASRSRLRGWLRAKSRTVLERLLIGLAIVGVSAVISILVT